jgi:hypothetical protein
LTVNSNHLAAHVTQGNTLADRAFIGGGGFAPGCEIVSSSAFNPLSFASRNNTNTPDVSPPAGSGILATFYAMSRSTSANYITRYNSTNATISISSTGLTSGNYGIFSRSTPNNYSNARIAFYSIGESLDLALLDTRVTTLINAFAAAIP